MSQQGMDPRPRTKEPGEDRATVCGSLGGKETQRQTTRAHTPQDLYLWGFSWESLSFPKAAGIKSLSRVALPPTRTEVLFNRDPGPPAPQGLSRPLHAPLPSPPSL